jgi:hypothetical protein
LIAITLCRHTGPQGQPAAGAPHGSKNSSLRLSPYGGRARRIGSPNRSSDKTPAIVRANQDGGGRDDSVRRVVVGRRHAEATVDRGLSQSISVSRSIPAPHCPTSLLTVSDRCWCSTPAWLRIRAGTRRRAGARSGGDKHELGPFGIPFTDLDRLARRYSNWRSRRDLVCGHGQTTLHSSNPTDDRPTHRQAGYAEWERPERPRTRSPSVAGADRG